MIVRMCSSCGARLKDPSPRQKYCSGQCRKDAHIARVAARRQVYGETKERQRGGSVERAVRERLEDSDAADWEKEVCYALAIKLDHPIGETASGISAATKALRLQMEAIFNPKAPATAPAAREVDFLEGLEDEVGKQRSRRRA